ncbi:MULTISPECIES: Gfo/Idh/MocA family protein [unclassified Arenibacter]|jgi:predicted dehydrogenase|uniref:Gfo/Idh/MocA family protein n=1 Tax=unclassified Arenibacter TaxID=2615047 RepID=UPI000E356929|nr:MULTISPECIES: Gfo/Idh/MocA family oxidoreductase [unclassified Arenibacter]MCM4166020.1 gfo/Idh/MocA family oxidoreductase [Arenibacter sp. A80]RFT54339.1 gfo/Idh/MocA family oxidoreductase [Arenibacter sp. P308M17]
MKIKRNQRREFIKQSGLGLMGLTLLPSTYGQFAPSDRLRVAHIGVGGMGNNHMKWFSALPEVDVVALCDVDEMHLANSLKTMETLQPGKKVKGYGDFRNILDRKDIDAITCATPDHWHAQIATLAFQAGKDVYGEKPLSYDVKEGQMMLKNLEGHQRIFQMGNQIHATDNFHRVVEILKAGAIGKVHTVRLWKTGAPPNLGNPKSVAVPKGLNWDMWLGPAPYVDYVPEKCHFTYRYFLDYSGGFFADFWCHIADVAFWALEPKGLKNIVARGEKAEGIADTPKWIEIDYEFEDLKIYWTTEPPKVPGAVDRGIGAYFEGDKGSLICDYNTREITINGETMTEIPEIPQSIIRSPGHQQNFVDSVKSRIQPESNLAYARQMTLPMHLGLISYRLGRKLDWDSENEKFIGDSEANALLSRKARKAWWLVS